MLDLGEVRDPLLAVVEALKACTSIMQRLASVMETVSSAQVVPSGGWRTTVAHLPAGMTPWVSPKDVAHAMSCSPAKAHEYLRAAAGRRIGTGQLLRVPVDVWEAWARENMIDGLRHARRAPARRARQATPPRAPDPKDAATGAKRYERRRRDLGPSSWGESKLPLIRPLKARKQVS